MTPAPGSVSGAAGGCVLLERTRALAVVNRAVAQAERGRHRVVVVSGPAGSGRSALLDEVCDALPRPWHVLDAAPPADTCITGPVAVLVDDADDVPPCRLEDLARATARRQVALAVLAIRPGSPVSDALGGLAGTLETVAIDLQPLTAAAVAELCAAAGVAGTATSVHRRTGGLPALVTAVLHHHGTGLPPAVVRHGRRTVAALPDEARALLELLAVAPAPVPIAVAESASAAADVLALRDTGLVHAGPGGIEAHPPLLAEVVRADLPAGVTAARRRQLARAWMLAPDPCAASIAGLLADAGDRLAARSFFLRAAEVAALGGDPSRAVALYLDAQRSGTHLDGAQLEHAARAAASVGRPGLADRWARQAEETFRIAGDDTAAWRVWQRPELAYVRRTALAAERPAGSAGRLADEAVAAARRRDVDADRLAREAVAAATAADDPDATGAAALALLLAGRPAESRQLHDHLRARAVGTGDHIGEAAQLRALSRIALAVGDPLAGLLHARAALAAAERGAGPVPAAFQRIHLGAVLTITGDLREAEATTAALVGDRDPTVAAIASIPLAGIDLGRGDPAGALERLAPLLAHRDAAGPDAFSGVLLQVAEAHVQLGDHDRARAVLTELDAWVGGHLEPTRSDQLALAGRMAAHEGDRPALDRLLADARSLLPDPGPGIAAVIELLQGLAQRGVDDALAAAHLRAAAVAACRAPRAGLAVTAWLDAADASMAAGDHQGAVAALDEGRRLAASCGIGSEDGRIGSLARALAAPGADCTVGPLTPRERSLLGLLRHGCTNKQMAGQLHLSEKTVRNQLSMLFAKLGVERRSQAAVLAVQLGIEPPDAG